MKILSDLEALRSQIEAEEYGMGFKESLVVIVCGLIALCVFAACASLSLVAVLCTYVGACKLLGLD